MKQTSLGLNLSTRKTRKREFLDEMERVVPWSALMRIVEPYCRIVVAGSGKTLGYQAASWVGTQPSSRPFRAAARTVATRCAPLGDQRIRWPLAIRVLAISSTAYFGERDRSFRSIVTDRHGLS